MRTPRIALLLVTPALALAACGGDSDEDKITKIVKDVSADPAVLCDHVTKDTMEQLGGKDSCLEFAESEKDRADPDVKIDSIEIDGDAATVRLTDRDGPDTAKFVKEDGDWKVTVE